MIDLMLDADCQQAIGFQLQRLAITPQGAHADLLSAGHRLIKSRHRQTAFLAFLQPIAGDDFRVDQKQGLVTIIGDVRHQHAQMDIHLRGGKANALGGVHGFQHVVQHAAQGIVHCPHWSSPAAQAGIGKMQDVEYGHGVS